MERYKSVMDIVFDAKDYGFYQELLLQKPETRLETIIRWFMGIALMNADPDTAAARFFSWVMQAISDVHLLPYAKEEQNALFLDASRWKETQEARAKARSERAAKAVELYKAIPATRREKNVYREDGDNVEREISRSILFETRKAILEEVCGWWGGTEDETEADRLFSFIRGINPGYDEKERKMLLDAVQSATGTSFPVQRLTRHALATYQGRETSSIENEIAEKLEIARARNCHRQIKSPIACELGLLLAATGLPPEGYKQLAAATTDIAVTEADIRELRARLQPGNSLVEVEGKIVRVPYIDGKMTVTYVGRKIAVSFYCRQRLPEILPVGETSQFCSQWETAKRIVAAWQAVHIGREYKVSLVYDVYREPVQPSKGPVFHRSYEL